MNRYTTGVLAALLAAGAAPLAAQEATDTVPRYRLEGVTVTTKRYPALRAELPQKIEVVTQDDIRRSPAENPAQLLKKEAALDVIEYPGLLAGVGIRGFRPEFSGINNHTLILIDGRPAGAANLATMDLNAVERIEVLKGPASSLYGSSAMGGAVNIITRRTTGELRGRASASYGSYQTSDVNAWVGGELAPRLDGDLGFSWFRRGDDFRIGEGNLLRDLIGSETAAKLLPAGEQPVEELGDGVVRDNTQYGYLSGSGRVGYRFGESLRADARGELFRADDVETPGDIFFGTGQDGLKNLRRRTGEVSVGGAMGAWTPLLRVYGSDESTEYVATYAPDPFVDYASQSRTYGAQLQAATAFGAHALTAGVDYNAAHAESERFASAGEQIGTYSPNSATRSAAAFAEGKLSLLGGRLTATAGARLDRVTVELEETLFRPDVVAEEESFTTLNPSFGAQYALPGGLRVHGTVGTAFVAPDAYAKAGLSQTRNSAGVASITVGNPAVEAERSLTWDAGLGIRRAAWDADVTYFRTRVDDRITRARASFPAAARPTLADGTPVGSVTTYANAAEAEIEGFEWRLGYDLGVQAGWNRSLRLFANATHVLRAEEIVFAPRLDATRFAGRTDFRPEEVAGAFSFGDVATDDIRNVAELTLGYGVEYDDQRRYSTRLSGRYVGERIDADFRDFSNISDIRYPSFMVLDWVGTVRLAERYSLSAILANLTDENYYEKRGYNLPGRELRLRFAVDM